MIKFVVMFRQPEDMTVFENAYNDFLALVERMPSIKRRQVVHVLGSPMGNAPYHRLLEIYFDTEDLLKASLMSPQGQEAGNELARFKQGSFDVQFAEVYEEEGGNTA
jgi:uncharacterized protein (TIGR02118 family)